MNKQKQDHILIAGLGISGYEAALLALSKNFKVTILDIYQSESVSQRAKELRELGCDVFLGPFDDLNLAVDKIVISPGIDPRADFGRFIHSLGSPVVGELEFAASFTDIPLIGITGTNGKTTTVEILTHCLDKLGKKVIASGNIGLALSKVVREAEDYDYIIVEVSSFQLESIDKMSFYVGALLNICSDHIDRYNSFEDYAAEKVKLLKHSQFKVTSQSVIRSAWVSKSEDISLVDVNVNSECDAWFAGSFLKFPEVDLDYQKHPLNGIHNAENLLVALCVLKYLGFKVEESYTVSLSYRPAAHRMQNFLKWQDIEFVNDSKSTNPLSLKMALESLGQPKIKNIVLIAGGRDKKMDFNIVNTVLCSYVRNVFIYGECRSKLFKVWKENTSCLVCVDFTDAVEKALNSLHEGDILLLSPGCSSLDAFSSYAKRGDVYMKTVQEWTRNER